MSGFGLAPAYERRAALWLRDLHTSINFAQDSLQYLNELVNSNIDAGVSGPDATVNTLRGFLIVKKRHFFGGETFEFRSGLTEALGFLSRRIAEPGRSFPEAGNKIAAFVSSLVLGKLGYEYQRSPTAHRFGTKSGSDERPEKFFARWQQRLAELSAKNAAIPVDEWLKDWTEVFGSWMEAYAPIAVGGTRREREHADREFNSLIQANWTAGSSTCPMTFLPVLAWAKDFEWYQERCAMAQVGILDYA